MINKVILVGNLGRDPEIRDGQNGKWATLSIATSENWKDKQGKWQSKTEWHRVVAFGFTIKTVENLEKGNQVYIEGSLQTRKWEDKDGNDRYTTEVKARILKRLGPKPTSSENAGGYDPTGQDNFSDHGSYDGTGEDVPF